MFHKYFREHRKAAKAKKNHAGTVTQSDYRKERSINMNEINELLPFLIPLAILEFGLFAYTLWHILTHKTYKIGRAHV